MYIRDNNRVLQTVWIWKSPFLRKDREDKEHVAALNLGNFNGLLGVERGIIKLQMKNARMIESIC
jgi:hypothetical protein